MAYTTIALVRAASGFTDNTKLPDASITAKIAAADSVINAKINGVYTIPLSGTSELIGEISLQITKAFLYAQEYGEESEGTDKGWQKVLDFYMALLDKIKSKEIQLLTSAGVALDASELYSPTFLPDAATSAAGEDDEARVTMSQKF